MSRRKWATQSGENYDTGSGCGRGRNIAKLFLQKQYHWGQSEHEMKKIPICGDKKLWSEFVDDTIYWGKLPQQNEVQTKEMTLTLVQRMKKLNELDSWNGGM